MKPRRLSVRRGKIDGKEPRNAKSREFNYISESVKAVQCRWVRQLRFQSGAKDFKSEWCRESVSPMSAYKRLWHIRSCQSSTAATRHVSSGRWLRRITSSADRKHAAPGPCVHCFLWQCGRQFQLSVGHSPLGYIRRTFPPPDNFPPHLKTGTNPHF